MAVRHPWQLLAAAMPRSDADALLSGMKLYRVDKSDLVDCYVCMLPALHAMRLQRLLCACKACADVTTAATCPWRARVMTCQVLDVVTVEEAYAHLTPVRAPRKPVLTPQMKIVVMDWAQQGLKPKRIWNALLQRFNLNESTAPALATVQRFVHHHVSGRLGGSDLRDAVRRKIQEAAFTGQEEEATAFTFTMHSDATGRPVTGNGSDADPFVLGISSKKLLRRADRDPASFILHVDATYKLTQVGYPVIVVGISDRARRFHLLAIFIVSQQQQQQHAEVLTLLRRVFTDVTGKLLRVRYVMGDADAAQWSAVDDVFGSDCDYVYLMCYFYVAKKVFEKTRSMRTDTAAAVMADIHDLHFARNDEAFEVELAKVQEKWEKTKELKKFSGYFSKVWLNQRFRRWQCFHTPCGFATTNNPCETYNAAIKRDVTLRRKLKIGALIPQLLMLCESESTTARAFATVCEPDARLVRRARAMTHAGLLSLHSATKSSIAFLLSDSSNEDQADVVRVLSSPAPRVYDETRRRTQEDLPVSSQLNKLTASMETRAMPTSGWAVNMKDSSCPCSFWAKYGSCIHMLYAMEIRGTADLMGRETLVNRSASTRKGASARAGRPKKNGQALSRE